MRGFAVFLDSVGKAHLVELIGIHLNDLASIRMFIILNIATPDHNNWSFVCIFTTDASGKHSIIFDRAKYNAAPPTPAEQERAVSLLTDHLLALPADS